MGKLIKMDMYRLFHSKLFWILTGVLFAIEAILSFGMPFLVEMLKNFSENPETTDTVIDNSKSITAMISDPVTSFLLIIMFVSVIAFLFADLRNGYIKNIAGQLPRKGSTAISKFVVSIVHNLIFMIAGFFGMLVGNLLCPKVTVVFDNMFFSGLVVFFLKLVLSMAMVSILLFITTGLRSKTFASIVGVLFSVSALGMLYTGINKLLEALGLKNFDIAQYVPDQLYNQSFDLAAVNSVISAFIVGIAFCVIFVSLTVFVFNKRDVK